MPFPEKVYTAIASKNNLLFGAYTAGKNIFVWRSFIYQLFKRDFMANYKKSFLGLAWLFIGPLISLSSWIFLNLSGVLVPGSTSVPYPVYLLLSLSFWGFFMGVYNSTSAVFSSSAGLLLQVRFPMEAMVAKQVLQEIVGFFISISLNILVISLFGVFPKMTIFLLPIICLPLILLACSLGLISSLASIVFPEVKKILDLGMSLLFFVTPILYTKSKIPDWISRFSDYNPLISLLGVPRDIIITGIEITWNHFFICSLGTISLFLICLNVFLKSERWLIEKI